MVSFGEDHICAEKKVYSLVLCEIFCTLSVKSIWFITSVIFTGSLFSFFFNDPPLVRVRS